MGNLQNAEIEYMSPSEPFSRPTFKMLSLDVHSLAMGFFRNLTPSTLQQWSWVVEHYEKREIFDNEVMLILFKLFALFFI